MRDLRGVFVILKFMSLCTLMYLALLYFLFIDSNHTGAAYSSCGNIAMFYIIFKASCPSLQLILAELDSAFISLVHLSVAYFVCSLNLNSLSISMPRYFILSTCSNRLLFNLWDPELFFLVLAHPVYKMRIIQEPNTIEL